jgi:aminoglycoside phosphotransferase family enzyme
MRAKTRSLSRIGPTEGKAVEWVVEMRKYPIQAIFCSIK